MNTFDLDVVAREQLRKAAASDSGRGAETVYGGRNMALRHTVVALTAGTSLSEHENPGEATVLVLGGRVRMAAAEESREGGKGELFVVPRARHSLEALTDATVLLTVVKQL
jgi:quercetin dioxygenase-like cupin family protein